MGESPRGQSTTSQTPSRNTSSCWPTARAPRRAHAWRKSCDLCWDNYSQIHAGELTFCHGKSPFLMGKSTISMAIFNCYVSSPEGTWKNKKSSKPPTRYLSFLDIKKGKLTAVFQETPKKSAKSCVSKSCVRLSFQTQEAWFDPKKYWRRTIPLAEIIRYLPDFLLQILSQ